MVETDIVGQKCKLSRLLSGVSQSASEPEQCNLSLKCKWCDDRLAAQLFVASVGMEGWRG